MLFPSDPPPMPSRCFHWPKNKKTGTEKFCCRFHHSLPDARGDHVGLSVHRVNNVPNVKRALRSMLVPRRARFILGPLLIKHVVCRAPGCFAGWKTNMGLQPLSGFPPISLFDPCAPLCQNCHGTRHSDTVSMTIGLKRIRRRREFFAARRTILINASSCYGKKAFSVIACNR